MTIVRYFLFLLGFLLAVPLTGVILLAIRLPVTLSGVGYLLAGSLVVAGLVLVPWAQKHYPALLVTGGLGLALIAGGRIIIGVLNPAPALRLVTLPHESRARWLSYLLNEQDMLILGEEIFHRMGGDSADEHAGVVSALHGIYSDMRENGIFPSPVSSTYLDLQGPTHFDVTIIESEDSGEPEFGVIFLHGYMGNVSAQCWVIGQAVRELGGITVCPSTGWKGEWWQPEGQVILQTTFNYLRGQGIQKIYLGGYSNGGFGIGLLASDMRDQKGLSGLIFIDGFANSASVRQMGIPILLIQGMQDERVPVTETRQFAEEIGGLGTYVELDADHFLIMKHPDLVQNAITEWLVDLEAGGEQ